MSFNTTSPSNDGARLYTMTDVYHLLKKSFTFQSNNRFANKMSNTDMNTSKTSVHHVSQSTNNIFFSIESKIFLFNFRKKLQKIPKCNQNEQTSNNIEEEK